MHVAIDVGELQSARLQYLDLRSGFDSHIFFSDLARKNRKRKLRDSWPKTGATPISGSEQRWHSVLRSYWSPVRQNYVTASSQRGSLGGDGDGFVDRVLVRHDCGRSHNACAMCLGDGSVYTRSHSEVVGIDDEAAHEEF
jgi:hypothetical protein